MRTIKFRAFQKSDSTMIEWETVRNNFGWYIDGDEDCILMQFTGLLDKNGKEVYEGDIVKHTNKNFTKTRHGYSTKLVEIKKTEKYIGYSDCSNYEIIGNIYSNPELLTNP